MVQDCEEDGGGFRMTGGQKKPVSLKEDIIVMYLMRQGTKRIAIRK